MKKFASKIQGVNGLIYERTNERESNKQVYSITSDAKLIVVRTSMYQISIYNKNVLKLHLLTNSRRAVYSAITYAIDLINDDYRQFIITNYGSVESFLKDFACTYEYCVERSKDRHAYQRRKAKKQ